MGVIGAQFGLRTRGGFNVEVKFEGEWLRFNRLIGSLDINMMLAAKAVQRKFAEKYRDKVKANIRTGGRRFGYPEHSKKYQKYKAKYGGGGGLFYWSGAMHQAVQVMDLRGGRVGVGIPRGLKREPYHGNDKVRLTISEYANVLEQGSWSRNIPARPLFADTFKHDMGGMLGLKTYMQFHIVREFRKRGINVINL